MKRYLADVLTGLRLISALVLGVLILIGASADWAFWCFVFGEVTDAFDGIAARKWPFPVGKEPKYRQYAELYDMVIDATLGLIAIAYIICHVSWISGLTIMATALLGGIITEIIVWGFPFGAPERCTRNCLFRRKPELAKILVLARRRMYLVVMATVAVIMLFATEYEMSLKLTLVGLAVIAGGALLIVKRDRLTEIKTK